MGVLNVTTWTNADHLATQIADTWMRWKQARSIAEDEWKEARDYVFATDTRSTTTGGLGWQNSTTLPKLTQIRDNLHANYMTALFPSDNWLAWEGDDEEAESLEVRHKILNYMRNRLEASKFKEIVSQLLYDYIDYGNVLAEPVYVTEYERDENGEMIKSYSGPKVVRVSPYDIVFDPTSKNFRSAAKVTRRVTTLGQLEKEGRKNAALQYKLDIVDYLKDRRSSYSSLTKRDKRKLDAIKIDGFGSYEQYITSGLVEVLEFEGDIYDIQNQTLLEDVTITVVDRSKIIRQIDATSFKVHTGWRTRPDNLWAMGPLANLVGMQYRIDHLENLRADIFDRIAHPTRVIAGDVPVTAQDVPGQDIYVGTEGSVNYLHPDATALNADFQIQQLEQRMEEFAGAPREAMGIRSPGEKTAFEVQTLQTAASRIFQEKITHFEITFLEPLLNEMFRLAKAHAPLDGTTERILDPETSVVEFIKILPEDLKAAGKLRPKGARHFAATQKLVQDLNNFLGSPVGMDESVRVHFSGKEIARLMNEQLDLTQYNLYNENIRILENLETARIQQAAQKQLQMEMQNDPTETEVSDEVLQIG